MNWIPLTTETQLEQLLVRSSEVPQVIFKHSTRCSISSVAKKRLEKSKTQEEVSFYFLDLFAYRSISNAIASRFNVTHESPQILVIKEGRCVYDESHMSIDMEEILENVDKN